MKVYIVIPNTQFNVSCKACKDLKPCQYGLLSVLVDLGKINFMPFEGEFESAEHLPALLKSCKMHFCLIFQMFAFQSIHSNHFCFIFCFIFLPNNPKIKPKMR